MKHVLPIVIVAASCCLVGCTSGPVARLFAKKERTSYRTPTVRTQEAIAIGAAAGEVSDEEQQVLLADLARRIQNEQDPLVREAIAESVAAFPQPLAAEVLKAGLRDSDAGVRRVCCQMLGERAQPDTIAALSQASRGDEDFDVRIEATRALGNFKSQEAVQALVAALEDDMPAMQYAGVEAMRTATGQDLGNRVDAYLALARGEQPTSVASRPEAEGGFWQRLSPF